MKLSRRIKNWYICNFLSVGHYKNKIAAEIRKIEAYRAIMQARSDALERDILKMTKRKQYAQAEAGEAYAYIKDLVAISFRE